MAATLEALWTAGAVSHVQGVQLRQLLELAESRLVVVDWFAPWCGPCQRIAPAYMELARKYPSVVFVSVDTEAPLNKQAMLAAAFQIRAFPTFTFHLENAELERFSGADPAKLESVISRLSARAEDAQLAAAIKLSMEGASADASAAPPPAPAAQQPDAQDAARVADAIRAAEAADPEPADGEELDIKVKRITGEPLSVRVRASALAQHLRRKVALELSADPVAVRLIFRGKILVDGQPLASYGVAESGLTVHVAVAKTGGAAHTSAAAPQTRAATAATSHSAARRAPLPPVTGALRQLRDALDAMRARDGVARAREAAQMMLVYARNVSSHPDDVKFRAIRRGNAKFQSKVGAASGGVACMRALGFEEVARDGEPYLVLQGGVSAQDMAQRAEEVARFHAELAPAGAAPSSSSSSSSASSSGAAGASAGSPFGAGLGGMGLGGMGGPNTGANPLAALGGMGGADLGALLGGLGGGGAGGMMPGAMPGVSPDMIQRFQQDPAMQRMTHSLMARMMQNPELLTSVTQAMASGQDPRASVMNNPQFMQAVAGVMSEPEIMGAVMQAVSGARGQPQPQAAGGAPFFNVGVQTGGTAAAPGATASGANPSSGTASAPGTEGKQAEQEEEDDDLDDLDDIYSEE